MGSGLSLYQLEEKCCLVRLQSGLLVYRSGGLKGVMLGVELRRCRKLLDELQNKQSADRTLPSSMIHHFFLHWVIKFVS